MDNLFWKTKILFYKNNKSKKSTVSFKILKVLMKMKIRKIIKEKLF